MLKWCAEAHEVGFCTYCGYRLKRRWAFDLRTQLVWLSEHCPNWHEHGQRAIPAANLTKTELAKFGLVPN